MYTHAKCINKVFDDEGTYCLPGKFYEIIEEGENTYEIDCEQVLEECMPIFSITIKKDDPDFEFYQIGIDVSNI